MSDHNLTLPRLPSSSGLDLHGLTFGQWTVLEIDRSRPSGHGSALHWICRCTCGLVKSVIGAHIVNGKTRRCRSCSRKSSRGIPKGNGRTVDLTGKVFGLWTVVGFSHSDGKKRIWDCRCECGNTKKMHTGAFRASRGCWECGVKRRARSPINTMIRSFQNHCKEIGREFAVTKEFLLDLLERQGFCCALSGLPIGFADNIEGHQKRRETTASLDRIDSTKGYLPGNVQWVHKHINKMKQDFTDETFIKFCQAVTAHSSAKHKKRIKKKERSDQLSLLPPEPIACLRDLPPIAYDRGKVRDPE